MALQDKSPGSLGQAAFDGPVAASLLCLGEAGAIAPVADRTEHEHAGMTANADR